jgi:hypothetical protein
VHQHIGQHLERRGLWWQSVRASRSNQKKLPHQKSRISQRFVFLKRLLMARALENSACGFVLAANSKAAKAFCNSCALSTLPSAASKVSNCILSQTVRSSTQPLEAIVECRQPPSSYTVARFSVFRVAGAKYGVTRGKHWSPLNHACTLYVVGYRR